MKKGQPGICRAVLFRGVVKSEIGLELFIAYDLFFPFGL